MNPLQSPGSRWSGSGGHCLQISIPMDWNLSRRWKQKHILSLPRSFIRKKTRSSGLQSIQGFLTQGKGSIKYRKRFKTLIIYTT